jgi:hypothetical protein
VYVVTESALVQYCIVVLSALLVGCLRKRRGLLPRLFNDAFSAISYEASNGRTVIGSEFEGL